MKRRALYAFFEERGLRLTQARRGFVRILSEAALPLSAQEILRALENSCEGVNKTTVYRELERWEALGLVEKVRLSGDEYRYELKRDHHHHVVCIACDTVQDVVIDEKKLKIQEEKIVTESKFVAIRHSLEFFGLCRNCQS